MTTNELANAWTAIAAALTAGLGAMAAFFKARQEYIGYEISRKRAAETAPEISRPAVDSSIRVLLAFTAVAALLLGVAVTLLFERFAPWGAKAPQPMPEISIAEPADRSAIVVATEPNGSSHFVARGISARTAGNSTMRIYLLVHPERPTAPGWWIQPEVTLDSEGRWSGVAWMGTKGFEAHPGDELWMVAVVAKRRSVLPAGTDGQPWVDDPGALEPAASSTVVHLTVASGTAVSGH